MSWILAALAIIFGALANTSMDFDDIILRLSLPRRLLEIRLSRFAYSPPMFMALASAPSRAGSILSNTGAMMEAVQKGAQGHPRAVAAAALTEAKAIADELGQEQASVFLEAVLSGD